MDVSRPRALHIEELVLHGFAPRDRAAVAAGLERELTRLVADRGLPIPGSLGEGAGLTATVTLAPDAPAGAIGTQVARAVHGALGR